MSRTRDKFRCSRRTHACRPEPLSGRKRRGQRGGEGRRGIYRARTGMIMGVCKGLARHFDLSVFWVRFFAVLLLVFTGIWPAVGLYLLAGLIMKPEPVLDFADEDEQEFYDSYAGSRTSAISRLKERFDNLDRRIRRMEDRVTSRDYEWEERLRNGG